MGPLFAGIDAGGTTTRCIVTDQHGTVLGLGHGGPGNSLLAGDAQALASMRAALDAALTGNPAATVTHMHISAAGTVVPEGVEQLAQRVSTGNDAPAALVGALVYEPGVIVIGGTGSAYCGQRADGQFLVLGGWGPLAGDEGSGYAIGREAIRLLALTFDGRAPSGVLTAALLHHLGAHDRATLQARLYDPPLPRDEVAALSLLVAEAAAQGDEHAHRFLAQAGYELAHGVANLIGQLGLEGAAVVTRGGVFSAGSVVLTPFEHELKKRSPGAHVAQARFPPVVGALLLAYRQEGVTADERLLSHLEDELVHVGKQPR